MMQYDNTACCPLPEPQFLLLCKACPATLRHTIHKCEKQMGLKPYTLKLAQVCVKKNLKSYEICWGKHKITGFYESLDIYLHIVIYLKIHYTIYRPFSTCFPLHTRHDMVASSMVLCYRVLMCNI